MKQGNYWLEKNGQRTAVRVYKRDQWYWYVGGKKTIEEWFENHKEINENRT